MPTRPPISAPAAAPPTNPVPVPMPLLLPTIAPPAPPIKAPVPAPLAVFDGATPEEQPVMPPSATTVEKATNLRNAGARVRFKKVSMENKKRKGQGLDSLYLTSVRF